MFWKTNSKAETCWWSYLCFVICLEQKCFGIPKQHDALFAQINVKSAAKGGYKRATLGGGHGFRGGHCETANYFLPHPDELDCSCVILARWQKAATRDVLIVLRDSVWL